MNIPSNLVLCCLLLSGALASTTALAAEMYKWTDENGVVHFSQTPPEGVDSTSSQMPSGPKPGLQSGADAPAPVNGAQPSAAQQMRDDMARKAKAQQQAKQQNQAQCASWQAEVNRLEPTRNVYSTNEAGETVRMDDVQRTDHVAELKSLIAKNCR